MNILDALEYANDDLREAGLNVELIIAGGAALDLANISFRETTDIDAFIRAESSLRPVMSVLERYRINDAMKHVAFIPYPDDFNYSDEIHLSNLTAYIASVEDVALMKLFTNRPKDYDDLVNYILPNIRDKSSLLMRCKQYESTYVGNLDMTNYNSLSSQLND